MAAVLDPKLQRQANALIAQQLPELHTLEGLYAMFLSAHNSMQGTHVPASPAAALRDHRDHYVELIEKIKELLSTPYAHELILLLLPAIIDIKRRGSEGS